MWKGEQSVCIHVKGVLCGRENKVFVFMLKVCYVEGRRLFDQMVYVSTCASHFVSTFYRTLSMNMLIILSKGKS